MDYFVYYLRPVYHGDNGVDHTNKVKPGDHLWLVYFPGIYQTTQARLAWPSVRGCGLGAMSAGDGEETVSSA